MISLSKARKRTKPRKAPEMPRMLDTSVFDEVLRRGNPRLNRQLADQLAGFVAAAETPETERRAVIPYLLRLLSGRDVLVRRRIAERLAASAVELDPDLLFTIVADEDSIALPFLKDLRILSCRRQLAIYRVGDEARRMALVGRSDVCEALCRLVAKDGEAKVVAALLDNANAVLSADDLKRIYVRFRDVPAIVERLMQRRDLPAEVRLTHVRLARQRLEQAMRRGELPASVALRRNIIATEERAMAEILCRVADDPVTLKATLKFMIRRELLTPAVVFRAACRGKVTVLAQAMALLAGSSRRRIERALKRDGRVARRYLQKVYRKSGLPAEGEALAMALFAVHAERPEGMPAKAFGREVLMHLMAQGEELSVAEKAAAAELLAEFTDGETKVLARRVSGDLRKAA